MSGRLSNLRTRLVKVERRLSDVARRKQLAECHCNCRKVTFARDPEEFEAEMNLPCPAHGFRDLGLIVQTEFIGRGDAHEARREQLVATYAARRARHQPDLELKRR